MLSLGFMVLSLDSMFAASLVFIVLSGVGQALSGVLWSCCPLFLRVGQYLSCVVVRGSSHLARAGVIA